MREGSRRPRPELRAGRLAARQGARAPGPDPARSRRSGSSERQSHRPVLGEEEIAFIVSRWTGIPVTRLQEAETARLLRMEDELHQIVVGQDEAIKAIVAGDPAQPRGAQGSEPSDRLVHLLRPDGRREDRAGARAGQVPVRRRVGADPRRHVASTWRSSPCRGSSARLRATWATRIPARSPRRCAGSRTRSSCSTRSRRRTRTCSTSCSRCSTRAT